MSVCFWLEDAVRSNVFEGRRLQALRGLYAHLKPDLEKKPWPAAACRQNPPRRQWPASKGTTHYYKIGWGNIYEAANSPAMGFADRWCLVVAYDVKPVRASLVLMQLGRAICNRAYRPPRPNKHMGAAS